MIAFGICPVGMSVESSAILTEAFRGFPQSLQANATTTSIRPRPPPSLSFPLHRSCIILPFDTKLRASCWLRRHRTYDLLTNLHRGLHEPYPHFYWFVFYWSDWPSTVYPTYEPQARFNIIISRSAHIFQKCRCQLIIVGARRVVLSSSVLRTCKYQTPPYKIQSLGWPGARDLCTPENNPILIRYVFLRNV